MSLTELDLTRIPAQRSFMNSTARELLYSGAFGAGKSRIGCEKGYLLSTLYKGNRGLVIRKHYTDLRDTTMDTWFRYVMPETHLKDYNKQEHRVTLINGSEILFYGMDQSTKVGSLEVGWIFADEVIEFDENEYLMLLGRIRLPNVPFHQIFMATNPSSPSHWLYSRFYRRPDLRDEGVTEVLESNALENPFTPDSYKDSLNTFRGRYKDRFVKGLWISFEGMVYDNWDPGKHILPRDTEKLGLTGDPNNPIPEDWDVYRVIDFGFTNPFTCQWWASKSYEWFGPEGAQDKREIPWNERVWVMFREIYETNVTVDRHAWEVRTRTQEQVIATYADWDAGDRALLEQYGVPTIKANKEVQAGIQSVHQMIGEDRLFILDNSLVSVDPALEAESKPTSILDEFSLYRRQVSKNGKFDPDEKPAKLHDHGMDAMRMLFHSLHIANNPINRIQTDTVLGRRRAHIPSDPNPHWTTRERVGTGTWNRESSMAVGARGWFR